MSETSYNLEESKSNRAKCRTCKTPIDKGDIRMNVTVSADPDDKNSFNMSTYHHVDCFRIPRKMKHMDVADFLEGRVQAEKGKGIMPERKEEIIAKLTAANDKDSGKKRKKDSNADEEQGKDTTIMDLVRQAAEEGKPLKKKVKKEFSVDDNEFKRMVELYKKYHKYKQDDLKDILRWNKQLLTGKKDFVLFKVIDGEIHGRLSNCPMDQGQLKFNEGNFERVCCLGRFDEDTQVRIPCSFEAKRNDLNIRVPTWFTQEPTEEEKEDLQKQVDAAKGKRSAPPPHAEALLKYAEQCDWDLTSKKGVQEATKELVELVQDKLDLPERDPKRLLGPIVMSSKDKGSKGIMEELIDKFGFKNEKEAKKNAAIDALEGSCGHPKNAALVMAFQELSSLYFKEKNSNAGISYRKAAAAVRDIEEEITADNALTFSKGKSKLPGIGKGTAEKMKEFAESGKIEKLEEKRAADS